MKELDELLAAYKAACRSGESCLIATLVKVEGSSYRRVGARMLLTRSGTRTGTLSGGCLEAEIQKKAWWLTEQGPAIEVYETSSEEGTDLPFGLGCRGTLHILLKRVDEADAAWLQRLEALRNQRAYAALATTLGGPKIGEHRLYPLADPPEDTQLDELLQAASAQHGPTYLQSNGAEYLLEPLPPRQRLIVLGAGDDAKPLVKFARLLGWDVTVGDGRSHLPTLNRFPDATCLVNAPARDLPAKCGIRDDDAVVVMTHSFAQDEALLGVLLQQPLRYLGQLGPRQRTRQLLAAVGAEPHGAAPRKLHSPIGLDIGAHTAETIALAIVAEVQATLSKLDTQAVAKPPRPVLDISASPACQ